MALEIPRLNNDNKLSVQVLNLLNFLAHQGFFVSKFGPLNVFDQYFDPLLKKVGHPWPKID